ncbi:MAG: Ig-like domain-containing protein [Calditrichia bacterium]
MSDFGGNCGGACLCFDQRIELLDPAGNVISIATSPTSANNFGRYRTQIGPETIPIDGIYSIHIRDKQNNGRGEYSIYLQNINDPLMADSLVIGENLLIDINQGEVDSYVFEAWPLDRTTIDMIPEGGSDVLPQLSLYDQQGHALALPDSGHIDYTFSSGGLFTLLAFSSVDESGLYRLNFTVEIPVNSPPIATPDTASTQQNTSVAIDVLANDSDPDSNAIIISSATDGSNGTVLSNTSYLIYTPDPGYIGVDEFTYKVTDTQDTAMTVVQVVTGITDIEEYAHQLSEYKLANNYPNPFNPMTNIEFQSTNAGIVRLRVYDVRGKLIKTLVNEKINAGKHLYVWNGTNDAGNQVSSGIYFYHLIIDDFTETKKMVLQQ